MRRGILAALVVALALPLGARAQSDTARAEALEASSVWRAENRLDLAEEALWAVWGLGQNDEIKVELGEVAVGQRRPHAARFLVDGVLEGTRGLADLVGGLPPASKANGLNAAMALRAEGKLDEAEWALRGVRDQQAAQLELGYIASAQGRSLRARDHFQRASEGADDAVSVLAYREIWVLPKTLAEGVFGQARDLRAAGDTAAAERLLRALLPFENRQRIALELGWTAVAAGDPEGADPWLTEAVAGEDATLAESARSQLAALAVGAETPPAETSAADTPIDPAAEPPERVAETTPPDAASAIADTMAAAKALRADGQYVRAEEEFERARGLGVSDQVIDMELAYTMLDAERPEAARLALESASKGPDADIAGRAKQLLASVARRLGERFLAQARAYRAEENYSMAAMSLETAEEQGGDACSVALERGYLEGEQGHGTKARKAFREAARCDDEAVSAAAKGELKARYRLFWGDLYAELYGWHRFLPSTGSTNLVPTVRVRGYIHPIPKLDLDPYIFAQISRDLASQGNTVSGVPLILADNVAMIGAGVLLRGWKRRVGIYAQAGPAFNLLDDGRQRVFFDARVAAFFAVSAPTCSPAPQMAAPGARVGFAGCAEVYAEAVWVSRFDNNVFTLGRGRLGFTALVTGPVAWQPIAEVRVFKDINNDYWNNLIDAGVGMRWRLLMPFGLDVMLGVHGGSYFGLENNDPAPNPLGFAELRLQAATYIAF
ncbi:MAG: hypothetical protein KDA24_00630 [Deltaproteobacteria bacterium]|nr:hypothetical protein [Deltaproteobacteria bacterium]